MTILDPDLLQTMRGAGRCSWCLAWCQRLEPAHIFTRGCGGGSRIDLAVNVVPLGSAFDCGCHVENHAGHEPTTENLLTVAAQRTHHGIEDIVLVMQRLIHLPGDASVAECQRVWREVRGWSMTAAGLFRRILKEQGMLPMRLVKGSQALGGK